MRFSVLLRYGTMGRFIDVFGPAKREASSGVCAKTGELSLFSLSPNGSV